MSYLVPKDIPNCCAHCPYNYSSLICKITKSEIDRDDEYRERLEDCPLIEIKTPHGRLGDLDELKKKVLAWLPSDPCGQEEKEFPFETDICVSMLMEIEDTKTIIEAERSNK